MGGRLGGRWLRAGLESLPLVVDPVLHLGVGVGVGLRIGVGLRLVGVQPVLDLGVGLGLA